MHEKEKQRSVRDFSPSHSPWALDARLGRQVWDTAGQERFRSMAPMYYRNANAALLVFDITCRASFAAVKGWVKELQSNAAGPLVLALVGNKADLAAARAVPATDAARYAAALGAPYTETSALHDQVPHCPHCPLRRSHRPLCRSVCTRACACVAGHRPRVREHGDRAAGGRGRARRPLPALPALPAAPASRYCCKLLHFHTKINVLVRPYIDRVAMCRDPHVPGGEVGH